MPPQTWPSPEPVRQSLLLGQHGYRVIPKSGANQSSPIVFPGSLGYAATPNWPHLVGTKIGVAVPGTDYPVDKGEILKGAEPFAQSILVMLERMGAVMQPATASQSPQTHPSVPQPGVAHGELAVATKLFLLVADRWGLSSNEIANVLGLDDVREVADLRTGIRNLKTHDMQHRAGLALTMAETVAGFLRSVPEQIAWLKKPRSRLGNKSVYDLFTSDSIEDLIAARDFVHEFAGR